MRIVVAAAGKFRTDAEKALYLRYTRRLPWKISLIEVEEKRSKERVRRRGQEGQRLRGAVPKGAVMVALDQGGRAISSTQFAGALARWRDQGVRDVAFLIGGADGLSPDILDAAEVVLSLGPMTWPHLLVRVLLAEQLYRASTILSGHPYHRA